MLIKIIGWIRLFLSDCDDVFSQTGNDKLSSRVGGDMLSKRASGDMLSNQANGNNLNICLDLWENYLEL